MLQSRFSSAAGCIVSAPQPSTPHVMANHRWGNGTARTGVSLRAGWYTLSFKCTYSVQSSNLYMNGVYCSYKNTIVLYLKTDPGDSHRLNSPPMRVDPRTEGENWLLNNRRAGLGINPRYHMSGVERGDDSVLFLSTNINNPSIHMLQQLHCNHPSASQLMYSVRSTCLSILYGVLVN